MLEGFSERELEAVRKELDNLNEDPRGKRPRMIARHAGPTLERRTRRSGLAELKTNGFVRGAAVCPRL